MSLSQRTFDRSDLSFTGRVSGWSARHRWPVVGGTIALLVGAFFLVSALGVETSQVFGAGDAQRGQQLVEDRFAEFQPTAEIIVFSNPDLDVADPAYQAVVEALVQELRGLERVATVVSFYDTGLPFMVSNDRRVLMARLLFEPERFQTLSEEYIGPVIDAVASARLAAAPQGFEIEIVGAVSAGKAFETIVNEDFSKILVITLAGGFLIMVLAFRAVVAALVPLVMAITAIFMAVGAAVVLSRVEPLNIYYYEMIMLIGLAVGIDYSLFIVNRFREERAAGHSRQEAIEVCSSTTGRAVFYAGITVFISLAGLLLTGDSLFYGLGLGAMIVVLLTIIASLTLLPALLSLLGDRVNWLRIPGLGRPSTGGGVWGTITDSVLARPAVFAGVSLIALIALSLPLFSLHIGSQPNTSENIPEGVEVKRGFELIEQNFTLGETNPLYVIVDPGMDGNVADQGTQESVAELIEALTQRPDTFALPFGTQQNRAGNLLAITVPLAEGADERRQSDAIRLLRSELIPASFSSTGINALVSGGPAYTVDARDNVKAKSPIVFTFVLGLAFLLLLLMFRSIVIPVKAIILNLLSVGAAYGVLVLIFQEGLGAGLLDFRAGVIEIFMPLFLFAVLFGLSMDYHMLVLNRVKEAYDHGHDNATSVSMGIKATAVLITSAALIMVLVFGAFATARVIIFKQIGVGLGVAILFDATVIRAVLLPASMKLLGDWNWYLPSWLEWLPRVSPEGERGAGAVASD
ncbi:MAG: MMPL family transporter [Chloroflexi bacterium]|nr:MMPL family transporter [Chloroflexota bacterium]